MPPGMGHWPPFGHAAPGMLSPQCVHGFSRVGTEASRKSGATEILLVSMRTFGLMFDPPVGLLGSYGGVHQPRGSLGVLNPPSSKLCNRPFGTRLSWIAFIAPTP